MSRIAPGFWTALAAQRGSDYPVRPPLPEVCPRLLGGYSPNGERCYLVRLGELEEAIEDARSRGIKVTTIEMEDESGARGRYSVVVCQDSSGHELFDLIGAELAPALASLPPVAAITHVLAKWRRFWGQSPRRLLSREEQLGMVGELWFLSRWLVPAAGPRAGAVRWRSPFRSRHDFEWPRRAVEVKTASHVNRVSCMIGQIDQLEPPLGGDLHLFILRVREEASASLTLPNLIADCRALLRGDEDALGIFETALLQTDYSAVHEGEYGQTRWRTIEERLYLIDESFSRLRPSNIQPSMPRGVSEVSYSLDLGATGAPFLSNAAGAADLLR